MAEARPSVRESTIAGLGTVAALAVTAWLIALTEHDWLLASFGGSCVILFGMPRSDMAQPRSLFGGHVISTVVGLVFLHWGQRVFGGPTPPWMIVAVGVSLALMMLTRTIHSPAGANPIVIFMEGAQWSFLVSPLAIGLFALFATAFFVNNRGRSRERLTYPRQWL